MIDSSGIGNYNAQIFSCLDSLLVNKPSVLLLCKTLSAHYMLKLLQRLYHWLYLSIIGLFKESLPLLMEGEQFSITRSVGVLSS